MKLFIPELGTPLVLTSPWTVTIYPEIRNKSFYKFLNKHYEGYYGKGAVRFTHTIPKDSKLTVERIYIRAGAKDFSSVTFRYTPVKGKASIRFWANLDEVNNIEYKVSTEVKPLKYPNGKFSIECRGHYGYKGHEWVCIRPWFGLFFTDVEAERPMFGVNNASEKGDKALTTTNSYYGASLSNHYKTRKTFEDACKKKGVPESLINYFLTEYENRISVSESKN